MNRELGVILALRRRDAAVLLGVLLKAQESFVRPPVEVAAVVGEQIGRLKLQLGYGQPPSNGRGKSPWPI